MEIEGFEILLVRSKARRRTIQAKLLDEKTIKVMAPYHSDQTLIDDFIKKSVKKLRVRTRISGESGTLSERAGVLRNRFIPEAPDFNIAYSDSLRTTWGKCFVRDRNIIINPKLKDFPLWVLDLVIIHEIAHLIYPDHGKNFRNLVSRYRLKERATGYLLAKGMKAADI
ncbi:MAG TPA: M48 family metallopeptidase [Clostridiales bacterium]|nr:M48 family metallopeptidase [Clostridiales bacterium]HQP69883.1 M48 family metallopeptidase [Clostridiales bacterium]